MLKAEMKAAIEEHACLVNDTLHRFRLQWAAVEPRWSARGARYLLAIELLPDGQPTVPGTTVHVVTRAATTRADLLALVEDAVYQRLQAPVNVGGTAVMDGAVENRIA